MSNQRTALGIIDVQRGFMPSNEAERLALEGFGELPVPGGEQVVPALNKLLTADIDIDYVFTTQDWHPAQTAHFAEEPNFSTTWPVHCVGDTPGSKLHPQIELPRSIESFFKGDETLLNGEDDTSYSGFNAAKLGREDLRGLMPRAVDKMSRIERLFIGGLALDYCVKATALDFVTKTNMEVIVLSDAVKPVAEETGRLAVQEMLEAGIRFMTVDEAINQLRRES